MQKYTIIYPPTISWHDAIYQRPHQLQAEFARQGHFAILANVQSDGKGKYWYTDEGLCISNDLKATLDDPAIKQQMEGTKVVFWVTYTKTMDMKEFIKPDIIVFDYIDECVDEFSHWENGIYDCMNNSDVVIVTSDRLQELIEPRYPDKTFVVRNGADTRQYNEKPDHVPYDLAPIKEKYSKVIGFHGSLQTWVDYGLIADIAKLRPDWGIALVGAEYFPATACKNLPNVYLLGAKKYKDLPPYVFNFDAGIIPFHIRDMTQSSNPIKMYEYLACGLPVVTTPLRECTNLAPLVRFGSTGEEFVEALEKGMKARNLEHKKYLKLAYDNSWTKRVEDILIILGGLDK